MSVGRPPSTREAGSGWAQVRPVSLSRGGISGPSYSALSLTVAPRPPTHLRHLPPLGPYSTPPFPNLTQPSSGSSPREPASSLPFRSCPAAVSTLPNTEARRCSPFVPASSDRFSVSHWVAGSGRRESCGFHLLSPGHCLAREQVLRVLGDGLENRRMGDGWRAKWHLPHEPWGRLSRPPWA